MTHSHWFRLENNLLSDPKMFSLEIDEIYAMIYLMCEASKANKDGEVFVNHEHARCTSRVPNQSLDRAIEKLKELHVIEIRTTRGRYASVRERRSTRQDIQDKTRQDSLENTAVAVAPATEVSVSKNIWESYEIAYKEKYGDQPLRNARVNSLLKALRARLPHESIPDVLRHYLSSQNAYYVSRGHSLECLVKDAEKIYTEWRTGKKGSQTAARRTDKDLALQERLNRIDKGEL